jgi:hypothetical protein
MNIQLSTLLERKWVLPTFVGVTAFSTGAVIGHVVTKRYFKSFDEIVPPQAEQMSLFDTWNDVVERETVYIEEIETVAEIDEIIEEIVEETAPTYILETNNVFANNESEWDYETELSTRTGVDPYVIHADEFISGEMGFAQSTITYYAGDDIMADELDTPIYNYMGIMGELKFGHGSKDPNVVYIRNETMNHEWEVLLHQGKYETEVLGHDIEDAYEEQELKHANSVPKFRRE